MTYLSLSFKANSTQITHPFTVNAPKDTKIDENMFISFTLKQLITFTVYTVCH